MALVEWHPPGEHCTASARNGSWKVDVFVKTCAKAPEAVRAFAIVIPSTRGERRVARQGDDLLSVLSTRPI